MADVFTKTKRSQVMAAVRSNGNKATELKLVSILRRNAITGWRRGVNLVGKPDFVFCRERVALFVDGCFWHGCRWHCKMPQTNRQYWRRKIARNILRDELVNQQLRNAGWRVIRIWGHSLASPDKVVSQIISQLRLAPNACQNISRA
jgi:DNA mismatch endonuclease, patch repair protein